MENSINNALTEEDRVAAVILAIQGHSVDKKQVVVVEGDDDEKFYERFLEMSNCDFLVNNTCDGYAAISSTCNAKGYANCYYLESVFSAGDFMRTELYAEIRKREENIGKNLLKVAA